MPKQRRLLGEEKENAAKILGMKPNKKLLQSHIKNAIGKNVVLKDLHNLKGAVSCYTHMLLRITNLKALGQRFQV